MNSFILTLTIIVILWIVIMVIDRITSKDKCRSCKYWYEDSLYSPRPHTGRCNNNLDRVAPWGDVTNQDYGCKGWVRGKFGK